MSTEFIAFFQKWNLKPGTLRGPGKKTVQGRKVTPIPDIIPTRTEYRRKFRSVGMVEMKHQADKALVEIFTNTNAVQIDIQKDGILDCLPESIRCNIYDLVYLSKGTITRLNPDQFALLRPCRGEIDIESPNGKFSTKNRYQKKNRFVSKCANQNKMKLVMIGKKTIENFSGKWYIHSIINLTTFERIWLSLQRRGALPLENLLLAQTIPEEASYEKLEVDFPIRKDRLMKTQIKAIASVCHDMLEQGIYCIHGPPGTGKTTTLLEMIYTMTRKTSNGELLLTGSCNTTVRDLVTRIMNPSSGVLEPTEYLMG